MHQTVKRCHTECLRPTLWLVLSGALFACFSPDPRGVEGALAKALEAVHDGDKGELFKVIDQRARHALISIVANRREAAARIRQAYPEAERPAALAALGDAARVEDAAELFAVRCDAACMSHFAESLGAPRELREEGPLVHLVTIRGQPLTLYHGSDTWYGLVWHTEELFRERDRAAAELEQVEKNAALYERRRQLE